MRALAVAVLIGLLALPGSSGGSLPDGSLSAAPFWPAPALSPERAAAIAVHVESRGGGAFDEGTGVGLGSNLVLTNAHLVDERASFVTRCGRDDVAVRAVLSSFEADLALVIVSGDPLLVPVALAPDDPAPGDPVMLAGYPNDGPVQVVHGRVEGYRDGDRLPHRVLRFSPTPVVGQSGSPLLDREGRLVGLAYAREEQSGQGYAIPASDLRRLIRSVAARELAALRSAGLPTLFGLPVLDLGGAGGVPGSARSGVPPC